MPIQPKKIVEAHLGGNNNNTLFRRLDTWNLPCLVLFLIEAVSLKSDVRCWVVRGTPASCLPVVHCDSKDFCDTANSKLIKCVNATSVR